MTSLRIDRFGGMAPKLSERLLPDGMAELARNTRLNSGELRGIRAPERVHDFGTTTRMAVRLQASDGSFTWLGLENPDADVVKAPLINDAHSRYYWTGAQPHIVYNSLARIELGDPPYKLGTPAPEDALSIEVIDGDGDIETRAYTYTVVNEWGEESAPAPVHLFSGYINGTWQLTGFSDPPADAPQRVPLTKTRIYRTVTGQSTVSYFYVGDIIYGQETYNDTSTNLVVSRNSMLESFTWNLPPAVAQGIVAHPNGYLVAFNGRDLYFSERYRPHAWPAEYVLSVEDQIVGLAVYNNMITVLTKGRPFFATGNHPANIVQIKSDAAEPCLSKGSIAASLAGVFYASPNGLVLYNESGPSIVSHALLTREEWTKYSPETLRGAHYGNEYIGFYSPKGGIRFSPAEPFALFSEVDSVVNVDNLLTDAFTGELWALRQNKVYKWEPPTGSPLQYRWLSKVYDFTRPINFGAMMFKLAQRDLAYSSAEQALYASFNLKFWDAPEEGLNPINHTPLNGSFSLPITMASPTFEETELLGSRYTIGGSPLFLTKEIATTETSLTVRIFADGELLLTFDPVSERMHRLPSGYKAHTYQFELIGNVPVHSMAIAEVAHELKNV